MPITAQFADGTKTDAQLNEQLEGGALDPDLVYFQYVCQTDGGGHDPNGTPDSHVRPAHAALHGTVWRLDDPSAPIPPLGFGCRCAMMYVAAPGTRAERVLPEAPAKPVDDPKAPTEAYLDEHAPQWDAIVKAAQKAPPAQATAAAYQEAKSLGYVRDIARMALDVRPPSAVALLGTGPLSGVGRAGRLLAERWRQGDLRAAAELRKKYPATYYRLLAEEKLPEPPL